MALSTVDACAFDYASQMKIAGSDPAARYHCPSPKAPLPIVTVTVTLHLPIPASITPTFDYLNIQIHKQCSIKKFKKIVKIYLK